MIKLAVIKEGKNPPDERVPFSPQQCKIIEDTFKQAQVFVQSSQVRRFKDAEYSNLGVTVVDDVSDCDIFFGVKEVKIEDLIENKTYFFFSHTIKKQPYNQTLLQAILAKNITLIDYECLVDENNKRIIGFGRYAGIVGAYNALLACGLKHKNYTLKPAYQCADYEEVLQELSKVNLPPLKFVLTGRGRVSSGAMEILDFLNIEQVSVHDYLTKNFNKPVYVQLAVTDYNKRIDGKELGILDFFKNYSDYESDFMRFAEVSDIYISCHFWQSGSPYIFSREDIKKPNFKINLVADVSCDIDGPVACTIRPSTIKKPLYGYHKFTEQEVGFDDKDAITVMAVDNLPCELPKNASVDFGNDLIKNVLPSLLTKDDKKIIEKATIAKNGRLTPNFQYLKEYAGEL